ncbi:hypothetical protein Bca52824_088725 [Brassica carinata]|uniref:Myb-like domain-containing protein n=1 Tax=Brassica carinata TaxID=52824 RepID=A0A8X7PDV2_BRACI|nr:hypothetical protein Bca52824_088725 [Brassica carinata]
MKKSRGNKDAFAGKIAAREGEKLEESVIIFEADNGESKKKRGDEKALLNTDDDAKGETGKRKRDDDCDLGAEEKSKKKKKKKLILVSKKKRKKPSELVRGKRFTKEEDELIKKGVLEYVEANFLGDQGINMVMNCKSHPKVKGCWKEITQALPWRPHCGVYKRAHTLFEEGSKGVWSKEDLELVLEYQKKHGNNWKTLADKMGKHRRNVSNAWRRIKFASKKKTGRWSREEYQNLFDLKRSQHGMLRDNIPWTAISDQLRTRDHTVCCQKWYHQLTSSMVSKGLWANVDDYRLLDELVNLDAACVDDVDWDDLLDNRDGDACRSRWNQMVRHIGLPGTKTFAEHVEVLSQRYCSDIAEDREDFDNRPFDP